MSSRRVIVVGGGAAGFFAAITCAEADPSAKVTILEKSPEFLSKVRISGGGRCNVTHACFEPRDFATRFPRGEKELIGPFQRFQARDTVDWFAARGVKLNAECDGRMFPLSNTSQTIIDCLVNAAKAKGVTLRAECGVKRVTRRAEGGFELTLSGQSPLPRTDSGERIMVRGQADTYETTNPHPDPLPFKKGEGIARSDALFCDRLLLATGGCRTVAAGDVAVSLGHTLEPPVPSLFTFHLDVPWLQELAGVSVESAEASVPNTGLRERGALLVTHTGLSGPVILRLSAWGARELHGLNYKFPLHVNWLPRLDQEEIATELKWRRSQQPARLVVNTPLAPLPARLWEQLVLATGIERETRWARLSKAEQHRLTQQLIRTELTVTGKSLNKEEFVTCGGVRLSEVNFRTMQSRICPGLYFAGELVDIDGITGGFNFQAAWTTGWIAGGAMAL